MKKRSRPEQITRRTNGATRRRRLQGNGRLRRLLGKVVALVGGAGLLVFAIVWADPMAHLKQVANRPIAGVTVEGNFRYLSQPKMQAVLNEQVSGSFLQLDMETLRSALEENPWVDHVSISRQWPDRLVVRVEEQQPIARWGDDAFLNMRGDIIRVQDNSVLTHLPLLQGDDRYARDVMENYVRIARLLSPAELGLREVRLDETLAWTLQLQNGLTIRVGREQVFERLQRMVGVWPKELADRQDQMQSIDLRYDNGFAVAWKSSGLEQLAMADGK